MSRCDQKDELGRITNSQLVVRIEKTTQMPMHVAQFCATGKPVAVFLPHDLSNIAHMIAFW